MLSRCVYIGTVVALNVCMSFSHDSGSVQYPLQAGRLSEHCDPRAYDSGEWQLTANDAKRAEAQKRWLRDFSLVWMVQAYNRVHLLSAAITESHGRHQAVSYNANID